MCDLSDNEKSVSVRNDYPLFIGQGLSCDTLSVLNTSDLFVVLVKPAGGHANKHLKYFEQSRAGRKSSIGPLIK